jgi:MYND finger
MKSTPGDDFVGHYPLNLTVNPEDLPKEEVKKMYEKVLDDQKRRLLLTEDNKPAVREPSSRSTNGSTRTGNTCAQCGVEGDSESNLKLMRCGVGKSVWYCSPGCQRTHWPKHKKICKAIQKQAHNIKIVQALFLSLVFYSVL